MKYTTIAFDMDGTLAKSKHPIDPPISELLCRLLKKYKVVVISGGDYSQYEKQLLSSLKCDDNSLLNNLYLMPTTGATMYERKNNEWVRVYEYLLPKDVVNKLELAFKDVLIKFPNFFDREVYGDMFEDRGTQVSFSGQGQNAPLEVKAVWDPDQLKRMEIIKYLEPLFPDLNIKSGGTTTIDITIKGVDKAFALEKFCEYLKEPLESVLFIGDALYPGGNDFAVKRLNIDTQQVDNDNGLSTVDTEKVLNDILDGNY